jgi:2-keto-3-deoxy-6-phosphogluconate aldolase
MASPHVAGIVALMAQKNPGLTAGAAGTILESAAAEIPLAAGCRQVFGPSGVGEDVCWGDDATGSGLITADRALSFAP